MGAQGRTAGRHKEKEEKEDRTCVSVLCKACGEGLEVYFKFCPQCGEKCDVYGNEDYEEEEEEEEHVCALNSNDDEEEEDLDEEEEDLEEEEEEGDSECATEDESEAEEDGVRGGKDNAGSIFGGDDSGDGNNTQHSNGAKHERDPTPRSPLDSYKTFSTPEDRAATTPRSSSHRKQRVTATQIVTGAPAPQRATPVHVAPNKEKDDNERVIKSIIKNKFSAVAPMVAQFALETAAGTTAGQRKKDKMTTAAGRGKDAAVERKSSSSKRLFKDTSSTDDERQEEEMDEQTRSKRPRAVAVREAYAAESYGVREQHNATQAETTQMQIPPVTASPTVTATEHFLIDNGRTLPLIVQVEMDNVDAKSVWNNVYDTSGTTNSSFDLSYYNNEDFDVHATQWTGKLMRKSSGGDGGHTPMPKAMRRTIELRSRSARSARVVQVEEQQIEFLMQGSAIRVDAKVSLPKYVLCRFV